VKKQVRLRLSLSDLDRTKKKESTLCRNKQEQGFESAAVKQKDEKNDRGTANTIRCIMSRLVQKEAKRKQPWDALALDRANQASS
jgi:hypothetical protein